MGKRPAKHPLEDNPFVDGLVEWMGSSEGQLSIQARDLTFAALEDAGLDAKGRKIVWRDGQRLSIEETAERIHAENPDVPRDQIEQRVVGWLENCAPEGYSEAQLEKLDRLIERWIDVYSRSARR